MACGILCGQLDLGRTDSKPVLLIYYYSYLDKLVKLNNKLLRILRKL